MSRSHDIAIVAAAVGVVLAVVTSIFGNVKGGGMPVNGWFSWHPVLMTLAFPGLMSVGRLSYYADSSWPGLKSKNGRRFCHRVLMSLAVIVALFGYLCIFKAHLPAQKFFGYDFKKGEWEAFSSRLLHVWCGYAAILLSLYQAATGMLKVKALGQGQRVFTSHGTIGKLILGLGLTTELVACYFWAWHWVSKVLVVGLSALAVLGGLAMGRPDATDAQSCPIAAEEATVSASA